MNDASKYLLGRLDSSLELSRSASGVALGLMIPFGMAALAAQAKSDQLISGFYQDALVTVIIGGAWGLWSANLLLQHIEQRRLVCALDLAAATEADVESAKIDIRLALNSKLLWRLRRWLLIARWLFVSGPLIVIWLSVADILDCPYDLSCPIKSAAADTPFDVGSAKKGLVVNGFGPRNFKATLNNKEVDVLVYNATLYLDAPNSDGLSILKNAKRILLEMKYETSVTEGIARGQLFGALRNNVCVSPNEDYNLSFDQIDSLTEAAAAGVRKGDMLVMYYHDGTLDIALNDRLLQTVKEEGDTRKEPKALLSVYLGCNPRDKELTERLLGKN
jgi:hypothetical protein